MKVDTRETEGKTARLLWGDAEMTLQDIIRPGTTRGLDFVTLDELRKRTGVTPDSVLKFALGEILCKIGVGFLRTCFCQYSEDFLDSKLSPKSLSLPVKYSGDFGLPRDFH
jgi:hypothetical protein